MSIWDGYFSDWDYILSLFPSNWKEKFQELKVLKFGRKFTGETKESDLLRIVFMHLACGFSLRTTVAEAKAAGIVDIVDVTLFNHFKKCGRFFEWCLGELSKESARNSKELLADGKKFKLVDGSIIREPGATGSFRRVHFAINLPDLSADQILVSGLKTGESLCRYNVCPNDVLIGDRNFMKFPGIEHVLNQKGDVIGRFSAQSLPRFIPESKLPFPLMPNLTKLRHGEIGDWDVEIGSKEKRIKGRICAVRLPPHLREGEEKLSKRHAQKSRYNISSKTLELCGYLLLFTTLPRESYPAKRIVDLYHLRWQIEIYIKRLKSLMELGQLHKHDEISMQTYLNGKLLIAVLIEKMIRQAEVFSPGI